MICPECNAEFMPSTHDQKLCNGRCRKRHNDRKYHNSHKAQARAKRKPSARIDPSSTHPCKRCGGPAPYRKVYCDKCKATPKGAGIRPLTTPTIRNARRHEQELIDLVVAKSIAEGRQGGNDDNYHRRWSCGLKGAKIG